jgi:DNA-binding transcriptional LysR family regulator
MGLSLRQVRYFIATADSGQVSQAANEVNVSQSAITSAIKQLEESLGVALFRRHNTGVTLTAEGTRFLQHARTIMAVVKTAEHSPLTAQNNVTGSVKLGVTYTVAGYFLPRHYARFKKSFPDIRVELHELPRKDIEGGLKDGSLDLAVILVSNIHDRNHLAYETLFRSRRRLWLPVEHPLLQAETIKFADLVDIPYVMLTVDEASRTARRYWQQSGLKPKIVFNTSSVEAVRSMVADGIGITILSDMVYRPWSLEGQRIELRSISADIPTMDVGVAWNPKKQQSLATRTLHEFFSLAFGGASSSV